MMEKNQLSFTVENERCIVFKYTDFGCDVCKTAVLDFLIDSNWQQMVPIEVWNQVHPFHEVDVAQTDIFTYREITDELEPLECDALAKSYFFLYDRNQRKIRHIFFQT